MILIDIPQLAYKTWGIEVRITKEDETRDHFLEREIEQGLERFLAQYQYSEKHDHVK